MSLYKKHPTEEHPHIPYIFPIRKSSTEVKMARVLIVVAFLCFAAAVMASEQNLLGDQYCSPTTVCKTGTHCCTATTCCPNYAYCCGSSGRQCCNRSNSLLAKDKFSATEAMAM